MRLNSKYKIVLLLLPFLLFLFSCTTTVRGYKINGTSKKRALSSNTFSTRSGSRYGNTGFGTKKQQKKSFKFNYGKYNSFGGKNKKSKTFNSVYGSQIAFGGKRHSNASRNKSVYGHQISFGKKSRHGLFSSSSSVFGTRSIFGHTLKKKTKAGKIYGSEIHFGNHKNNSAKYLNNSSIGKKRGFFSFDWLKSKHKNESGSRKGRGLQLRLFDPNQRFRSGR
jgi:hypothetical protein